MPATQLPLTIALRRKANRFSAACLAVVAALCLTMLYTAPARGQTQQPGGSGQPHVFLPYAEKQVDGSLAAALDEAVSRLPADGGRELRLIQLLEDKQWALAVYSAAGAEQPLGGEPSVEYVIAQQSAGVWSAAVSSDAKWQANVALAPSSIMHPSLRQYLVDRHAAAVLGPSSVNAPALRLPWYPRDNPRSISGYLYNTATHSGADAYAHDWGLTNMGVAATAGGTVVDMVCNVENKYDPAKGYGNYVKMNIGDSTTPVYVIYAHLQRCDVALNKYYPLGSQIGVSGTSGNSTGPHLHFTLRDKSSQPVKPEPISGYSNIQKGTNYISDNDGKTYSCDDNSPEANQVVVFMDQKTGNDWPTSGGCKVLNVGFYNYEGLANSFDATFGLPANSISAVRAGRNVEYRLCSSTYTQGCSQFYVGNLESLPASMDNTTESLQVRLKQCTGDPGTDQAQLGTDEVRLFLNTVYDVGKGCVELDLEGQEERKFLDSKAMGLTEIKAVQPGSEVMVKLCGAVNTDDCRSPLISPSNPAFAVQSLILQRRDTEKPTASVTQPAAGAATISPDGSDAIQVVIGAKDNGNVASGIASVSVWAEWKTPSNNWLQLGTVNAAKVSDGVYSASFSTCNQSLKLPNNSPVRFGIVVSDKVGLTANISPVSEFRYYFPDVNDDCNAQVNDIIEVLRAVFDSFRALPKHDINRDSIVDLRDMLAVLNYVFSGPGLSTSSERQLTFAANELSLASSSKPLLFLPLGSVAGIGTAQDVDLADEAALVTDWRNQTLTAVDLSDIAAPRAVGDYTLDDRIYGVSVAGTRALVTNPNSANRLLMYDISAPLTPTLVTSITLPGELLEMSTAGNLAYIASGSAGVQIVEVAQGQSLSPQGVVTTTGWANDVAAVPPYAYVADRDNGFVVVDVQNAADPRPVAQLATPGVGLGVVVTSTWAYLAGGLGGVSIVDISSPGNPRLAAVYPTASAANSVIVHGSTLYVAAGWEGVLALDITVPDQPQLRGAYDTPGYVSDLKLANNVLVVADGDAGLHTLRVVDATPVTVGGCNADGILNTADLHDLAEEILDGDGSAADAVLGGAFAGSPIGCDANSDSIVDAGDVSCTNLLVGGTPACQSQAAQASAAPTLVFATESTAAGGSTTNVTLQLGGSTGVNSLSFSLDFDESLLSLLLADENEDGSADGVVSHLPPGYEVDYKLQPGSAGGKLDVVIYPVTPDAPPLPDGALLSFLFSAGISDQQMVADVSFGSTIPVAAGTVDGRTISVTASPGRVQIVPVEQDNSLAYHIFMPLAINSEFATVYENTFEWGAGLEWSSQSAAISPNGRSFLGQFGNETASLALLNLPNHTKAAVSFDLYVIGTWDGNTTGGGMGPDIWSLTVQPGQTLLRTTFGNSNRPDSRVRQAFPGWYPDAQYPVRTGAAENNTLGYPNPAGDTPISDAVYHLQFEFDHSGDQMNLDFAAAGLQALADEGWGIDNLQVRVR